MVRKMGKTELPRNRIATRRERLKRSKETMQRRQRLKGRARWKRTE